MIDVGPFTITVPVLAGTIVVLVVLHPTHVQSWGFLRSLLAAMVLGQATATLWPQTDPLHVLIEAALCAASAPAVVWLCELTAELTHAAREDRATTSTPPADSAASTPPE